MVNEREIYISFIEEFPFTALYCTMYHASGIFQITSYLSIIQQDIIDPIHPVSL